MNVLLVNGSPRAGGCTNRALIEVSGKLESLGAASSIWWLGNSVAHCNNCRACKGNGGICVLDDVCGRMSVVNSLLSNIKQSDAVVFGSPVYYGGMTSQLKAALTRLFYSNPGCLRGKPVAGVFSSRRAGSTSAMSELNLFFLMHSCNVIGSQYWNEVHGDTPDEVELDYEGLQTMRTLACNIYAAVSGLPVERESPRHMNFISREFKEMLNGKH